MQLSRTRSLIHQAVRSASNNGIIIESFGNKKVITLDRPKSLNALDLGMVREMYPKLKEWNEDGKTKMVIIKGSGEKAFCAGGDVLAVTKSYTAGGSTMYKDFFREEYILNNLIATYKIPYIALIDGITMGGGCGLSINGKYRIATEKTLLAMPETALGLFPDVGGSYFLPRLPGKLGLFLALTGYRLKGLDVYFSQMATHFVNSSDLAGLEKALLALNEFGESDVNGALSKFLPEAGTQPTNFSLTEVIEKINKCFTSQTYEGILKNLEEDGSEWALKQLSILNKMSPTSLKVTFQQLEYGSKMTHSEVFPMEYRLTQRFVADHDFHEGCRAILVDKDRNPKWKPSKLEDVSEKTVANYFKRLPESEELTL
uniref:3-hydroxyisobutyryl-CoA hydrolase, mitochondrial n=1 Tax=Rhabditophanes sp. KR3021 TaxID=114890 RepID=A0AC35UA32_9BILA